MTNRNEQWIMSINEEFNTCVMADYLPDPEITHVSED